MYLCDDYIDLHAYLHRRPGCKLKRQNSGITANFLIRSKALDLWPCHVIEVSQPLWSCGMFEHSLSAP